VTRPATAALTEPSTSTAPHPSRPRGRRRGLSGAAIAIWAVIGGLGILFGVFAVAIALQAAAFDAMRWLLALAIEAPLAGGIIVLIWYSRALTRTTAAGDAASSALANSEAKYRELIASAPDGIFVLDPQAKVLDVNEAGETLLGRERGDIVGHSFMEFVPTDRLASADSEVSGPRSCTRRPSARPRGSACTSSFDPRWSGQPTRTRMWSTSSAM